MGGFCLVVDKALDKASQSFFLFFFIKGLLNPSGKIIPMYFLTMALLSLWDSPTSVCTTTGINRPGRTGLIQIKEEGWTGFFKGWQG